MNSPKLRFSAAAVAAVLATFAAMHAPIAWASLADHPEPANLDPTPPIPAPPAAPPAPPASPSPSTVPPTAVPAAPLPVPALPAAATVTPKADRPLGSALSASTREEILSLARKGMLDSAFGLCKTALDSVPADPFLLLMMGKLSPSGKESSGYFKKAIKTGALSKEAEESHFRLGQFHYAEGKYHLAIPFFRDYLRLFPKGDWKEPAAYWMGNACLSLAQGRPDRAAYLDSGAAWFQKLSERSRPEDYYHPLALEGLAKAKAFKGDREGAWQYAKSALEKAPEEEQSPLLLLAAQLRQGLDRNEEKSYMGLLMGRYPQSPEARYLRKLNAGVDTSKWKSGSGWPRPAPQPSRDSLAIGPAAVKDALSRAPDSAASVPVTSAATRVTPKPPQATSAAGTATAGRNFTLQLGAFSQTANAQAMMATLTKLGLAPELISTDRGGKRIHQVRVGRFPTSEEAEEFAKSRLKPHRLLSQPVPVGP